MRLRPHIQKMVDEGIKAFNHWQVSQDTHDLGIYQGLRFALLHIQLHDPEPPNRDEAEYAYKELSTYGNEHEEEEVAARH